MADVMISVNSKDRTKTGLETIIAGSTLKSMPTISRSIQDFVRLVPQAKVNGEGVMALAGQNNRFNAFFIDGANNTDIKGLSVNGMNGGQTGAPPVSIEAIEEITVLLAPYHVQYGNFTGRSINAITRSGSNETKSSAWYFFRNENLAGRSPQLLEKPGDPGKFHRPQLSKFFNQVFGVWNSGALIKNKLFYFALIERQSESRPQPFNMNEYRDPFSLPKLSVPFPLDFYIDSIWLANRVKIELKQESIVVSDSLPYVYYDEMAQDTTPLFYNLNPIYDDLGDKYGPLLIFGRDNSNNDFSRKADVTINYIK